MVRRAMKTTEDYVREAREEEKAKWEARCEMITQEQEKKAENKADLMRAEWAKQKKELEDLLKQERERVLKIQKEHQLALEKLIPAPIMDNEIVERALKSVVKSCVVKCQNRSNLQTVCIPELSVFS